MELGVSPFLFGVMCSIGGCCGAAFPLATGGIVAEGLVEDFGWNAIQPAFTLNALIGHTLVALVIYIILKGWKIHPTKVISSKDLPAFNRSQRLVLLGILVFMIAAALPAATSVWSP
jgi:phage shock protein PspC (stress-responsive transcriptional regulator)